jgi:LPXTG-motif cell wall-anchored protein
MPVPDVAAAGDGDQTMFMVLIGLVLLAAAGALIVIRKNKAKKMDLGQTQI